MQERWEEVFMTTKSKGEISKTRRGLISRKQDALYHDQHQRAVWDHQSGCLSIGGIAGVAVQLRIT